MMRLAFVLLIAVIACSCAPIQHTSEISQPANVALNVGVGDVMVRVDKQRNLVNALGGADIFGRKTYEGYAELRFGGVEPDGTIVLYRTGTEIITDETTISRSGLGVSHTTYSGTATGTGNVATFNGTSLETTVQPQAAYHVAVPQDAMALRFPAGTRSIVFEGHVVDLTAVSAGGVSYVVHDRS